MKLNRDYIIGAFIGGAAVSLLNVPRISSLKEDSKAQQASFDKARADLELQKRQAQSKDEIIELQRQQMELDKTEVGQLRKANDSLHSRVTELENRPPPPPPKLNGLTIQEYFYIVHVWREHSTFLSNQVNNLLKRLNVDDTAASPVSHHNLVLYKNMTDPGHTDLNGRKYPNLKFLAESLEVNTSVFNTFNGYLDI